MRRRPSHAVTVSPGRMTVRLVKPNGLMRSAASNWAMMGRCLGRRSSVGWGIRGGFNCVRSCGRVRVQQVQVQCSMHQASGTLQGMYCLLVDVACAATIHSNGGL